MGIIHTLSVLLLISLAHCHKFKKPAGCALVMVGKVSWKDETNNAPLLYMSDLEKFKAVAPTSPSCVSLVVKLPEGEVNASHVLSSVNAIPKEKQQLKIIMKSSQVLEIDPSFKCNGYPVEILEMDTGKTRSLCSASWENLHIGVSYYCFFPYCIPDYGFDDGTSPYLLNLVVKKLGVVVDRIFLSEGYDLRPNEDGKIIGMVGDVATFKADLGLGQPSLTAKRYQHIDYTNVISKHTFGFCSAKPRKLSPLFAVVRPFQLLAWISIPALLFAIMATFFILQRFKSGRYVFVFSNFSFTFRVVLWKATNMYESVSVSRVYLSWKLLAGAWLFAGMLLNITYSSELLAEMVVLDETQPFDTVDQMLESNLRVFLLEGSIMGKLMKISARANMRELYQKGVIDQKGTVKSGEWQNADMLKAHKEGRAVRVCTPPYAVFQNEHFSKEVIALMPSANVVAKGSSLRAPLEWVTSHALAAGLMQRKFDKLVEEKALIIKKEDISKGEESDSDEEGEPLSLHHFYGIFIIWIIGLMLGLATFSTSEAILMRCF